MSSKKFNRNKQEKINLIYDTFFKLILKRGYHKTSTNHVAKSAKISIGTIYKYFPKGKEDIIRKYFEESMETFLDRQNLDSINDENIRDFLNHFVLELFKNHQENKGYNLAFSGFPELIIESIVSIKNCYAIFFQHIKKKSL